MPSVANTMNTLLKTKSSAVAAPQSSFCNWSEARRYWFVVELTEEKYARCVDQIRAVEWGRIQNIMAPGVRKMLGRASECCLVTTYGAVRRHEVHFVASATKAELRGIARGIPRREYEGIFPGKIVSLAR